MPAAVSLVTSDAVLTDSVLDSLAASGALSEPALARGRRVAEESGERIDQVLNKLGLVTDDALTQAWATAAGLSVVPATDYPEAPVVPDLLAPAFLAHARAIPLRIDAGRLELAVVDALDRFTPAAIAAKTGLAVTPRLARPGEFAAAFTRLYESGRPETGGEDDPLSLDAGLSLDVERLLDLASDAPVVRVVNRLIDQAIERGASDLHISATRSGLRVRYRIDGLLRDAEAPPPQLHAAIISRLKIMAGLDIAERRLPQDGRIRLAWRGREIDLRIAIIQRRRVDQVIRYLSSAAVERGHTTGR